MRIRTHAGFGVVQFLACLGGAALMVGTVIGQAGQGSVTGSKNPMAAMRMIDGSMSSMPAMTGEGGSTTSRAAGDLMTMADGTTMDSSQMPARPMPDSEPARSVSAGHSVACSRGLCKVVLTAAAADPVRVLGTSVRLQAIGTRQAVLIVGGRKLTVRQGRAVFFDNMKFDLTGIAPSGRTVTVSVRRVRGGAT
jgi:hypothetical protein